jgi:CoA:oxalate CoA-transferase
MPEKRQPPPLAGIIIIDLTRVLAGPFCTMLLLDLGARVIKVERPERGDDSRHIGPFVGDRSAYFLSLNRGKESIALDLRDEGDFVILERLIGRADVLVENFRPGAMERLGLGWESLHARFPRLIYAATSGFGQNGPYATRAAYDMVVQAMGGIMSITGQPGAAPTRVGTSIGDLAAGLFTALGVVSALHGRAESGVGTFVDVSMLDCQVALLENAIARFAATGRAPGPLGSRHPSIAPFQAFRSADGHVVISAGNDALFAALTEVLERPDLLGDPRFANNQARNEHVDALQDAIESATTQRSTEAWLERLHEAGVPCGPIQDVDQVLRDPQVVARNMVVHVEDPELGAFPVAGNPIKLSGVADPPTRSPPPDLDADRERVLRWLDDD